MGQEIPAGIEFVARFTIKRRRKGNMTAFVSKYQALFALLGVWLACGRVVNAQPVDYARDVMPIFENHCIGCHTIDDAEGGLVMEDFAALMNGGNSGVAITAGEPASSRLLLMASGKMEPAMPPDEMEGLSEQELETLASWIEQGAKGPDGKLPVKRELRTPKIEKQSDAPAPVTAIAISPNSGAVATGRFGEVTIEFKDSELPGDRFRHLRDADLGKVNSLVFSKNGQQLLVASGLTGAFGRAAIYDVQSGDLLTELLGHRDTLYSAEFSPDERLIATAGYDRKIVIWDAGNGEPIQELRGHNGAIFDLVFSRDGKVLVSGCADETVKIWNVETGIRLDTLGQSEGEVLSVGVTRDNRFVVAVSADNRLRVWRLESLDKPAINPLVATRFIDETPVVNFVFSPGGRRLVGVSQSGNVKVLNTETWQTVASLESVSDSATDLAFNVDATAVKISLMNGKVVERDLGDVVAIDQGDAVSEFSSVYLDMGPPTKGDEQSLRERTKDANGGRVSVDAEVLDVDRNVLVTGVIDQVGETDLFRWRANKGEVWAIDVDATAKGRLDPVISVLDESRKPIIRTRLQAVRDSYFTFRGKDSDQIGDFRLFAWQEMKLNEYLYAAGEVTRLAMHPRGPDSGFNVYPNEGKRWTYFGTSGRTHALGEPAYIVRELSMGNQRVANGLPVFDIPYTNDDDPQRVAGKNSRLLFVAPRDGLFTVRVSDTRGEGGKEYGYSVAIRAAKPAFVPSASKVTKPMHAGTGREFRLRVEREDGFEGAVTFDISGLPEFLESNFPVTVEPGQRFATAVIWASSETSSWSGEVEPSLVASAMINGVRVERPAGQIGKLTFDEAEPKVIPRISLLDGPGAATDRSDEGTLRVRRGETVTARVSVVRQEGFTAEVSFGKEYAGRNASQGVYVDNIGLNGLLIVAGSSEREFFVTADETAVPGRRSFFLTANVDGGLATRPIMVEVLP